MPESEHGSADAIYVYLKWRVEHDLQSDSADTSPSFTEWGIMTADVKTAYPGCSAAA